MLEVKMIGTKEPVDTELDSQVDCWNNSFCSVSESFSSIKEEDVGEDDQIRVVKIGDLLSGERKEERGEYAVEYSHTRPNEGEEGGYDAMITQMDRDEKMMEKRRVKEWMMEKINLLEHEGEVEEVFVIENSNPEEDGWREFVVGEEEWCMEETGERTLDEGGESRMEEGRERRMEEAGERRMEDMWVKRRRVRKIHQWWRYEPERKKTEEDEWKMIAEKAMEGEKERQKGQAVEEKKRVAGFRCPQCSNTFQSRSNLLEHKTSCCADPGYTCLAPLSPKHSPPKDTPKTLTPRQKTKKAGFPSQLRKTYFCPLCNRFFRNQSLLDKHGRSHTSLRNVTFCCSFCSLEFPKKIEVKKHYDTEHPCEVPRCEDCGTNFSSIETYLNHHVRHLTVTPYYCDVCHIYQTTQRGLTVHLKNHALRRQQVHVTKQ